MRIGRQLHRLKTAGGKLLLLAIALAASAMLAGCPLPFEYNGAGATNAHTSDPSSPNMTSPVTVSYSVQGGPSGTIADGGSFVSGQTTTVTLSTTSLNSVIFYTDNGTALTDLRAANKINATSGEFTITRTTSLQSMNIHAVAVGPNMLPSPQVQATVAVSPFPILSVTSSAASISEDGGTATFTITASSAPTAAITVSLLTGGSYAPAEVTGLPASGTTFTVTLAQSATSVAIPITANHDANGVNENVTLEIRPDPANPPAYSVGSPASAALLIQDDNAPVLTLTADRATMTNLQTATFTVNASFAPLANLAVTIASSGYAAGKVMVPPSGTIPSGATSAQFQVTASTGTGYETQNPLVSIAAAAGYSVGSPGSQSLQISDAALGVFNYDGVWGFNSGAGSAVGSGASWNLSGPGVSLSGGSLNIAGNYSTDTVSVFLSGGSTPFNQDTFTIGVKFTASDLTASRPIIVGGIGWRWIMVNVDTSGNLSIDLNNHAYTLPLTGMTIAAGTSYTLVLNVSVDPVLGGISITAWLNGSPVSTGLAPGAFNWVNPASDTYLTASDYSNGRMFKGTWDWVFAANGLLDYTTVVNLTAAVAP